MDAKEIYVLLNSIQTWIFWSFFTIFPISAIVTGCIGRWLMDSFLNKFDNRYNLTDIAPTGINVFERGKKYEWEVAYGKVCILNALARYYLKPYRTSLNRRKNEQLIRKYRAADDPYFLACCKLLDEQNIKENKLTDDLNYKILDTSQTLYKKDLAKFLFHDRYIRQAKLGTALILMAFISYKFIIPGLKNYYWGLMWGY